ncbi:MAG TPA: DUF2231 domain-containing protein [Longimicrobiaceae bacterium]|nr:DUF2231 domain-containing protein [Longimicrobiaceae bacterium]
MRSRASYNGHPIHPALIPFPFAFLIGAFFFELFGKHLDKPEWWTTGSYLMIAGIVMALVAAVPGIIDYYQTVPPHSSGKKRATKHGIVNLSAVVLFAIAWWIGGDASVAPDWGTLLLQAIAIVLLTMGGWMGGVLVNRNQIGVDHRYAGAGKWKEAKFDPSPGTPITVARADELEVDQMKLLHIGDDRIVLARTEDGYVAFDDHCPHRGGSLAGGMMICGTVQCPWHGSQFDVRSGAMKAGPAEQGIGTYEVAEGDGEVTLILPEGAIR